MKKITEVYKIAISAGGDQIAKIKITSFECTETEKSLKWNGTLLSKNKLNKVDSVYTNNNPSFLFYHVWCLESDIEGSKRLLFNTIREKIALFQSQTDALNKSFNDLCTELALINL